MKIVDKLFSEYETKVVKNFSSDSYLASMHLLQEHHINAEEKAFKAGYQAAILEILKWDQELKSNTQDGYHHIVTIRAILDVLSREY